MSFLKIGINNQCLICRILKKYKIVLIEQIRNKIILCIHNKKEVL